jgi:hypothetical protein
MSIFFIYPAEIIMLLFLLITFLQSGIDKLIDWNGNITWLKDHFSKSIFKNVVPLLLSIIVVFEMITSVLCIAGVYQIFVSNSTEFAFYSGIFSCITLLMLLFGQRIAKDYEGAKTIVVYFIPAIFLVFILQ